MSPRKIELTGATGAALRVEHDPSPHGDWIVALGNDQERFTPQMIASVVEFIIGDSPPVQDHTRTLEGELQASRADAIAFKRERDQAEAELRHADAELRQMRGLAKQLTESLDGAWWLKAANAYWALRDLVLQPLRERQS